MVLMGPETAFYKKTKFFFIEIFQIICSLSFINTYRMIEWFRWHGTYKKNNSLCLYNDVFIHIRCFLFMLLLCFLCYIILCCVIHFLHIYFFRRCAKTIISLIYSLPYRCANGPFINIALTPVYFTKLAAVYLRCLEKQQQQIKSKNITLM